MTFRFLRLREAHRWENRVTFTPHFVNMAGWVFLRSLIKSSAFRDVSKTDPILTLPLAARARFPIRPNSVL